MLAWSVPLYDGCLNLEEYFPPESFIRIDISKPEKTLADIRDILKHDSWDARLPALAEARRLILQKYQLFPCLAGLIQAWAVQGKGSERIIIPAHRRSNKLIFFSRDVQTQENVFQDVLPIVHRCHILNVATVFL